MRRGENVEIRVPLFRDTETVLEGPFPGEVYMDAMAFGMGMCCLQTTYLTKDITHARYLYDQLSILSPLFMALSAGTPFAKGRLLATDTRWDIISASVDDRSDSERDSKSATYIPKSRYSSISQYLSKVDWNLPEYDDIPLPLNQEVMEYARQLAVERGISLDDRMIKHLGFLTMRDFIILY
jgi:glutamate--cysteine ligase catalytic subunit